jgi:hypothetical protein
LSPRACIEKAEKLTMRSHNKCREMIWNRSVRWRRVYGVVSCGTTTKSEDFAVESGNIALTGHSYRKERRLLEKTLKSYR